ncbi:MULTISPECIES: ATP-binding protein [unclassified Moraxella]|uniref:ATP-binding protein n=1 Tax=unclassified Moraxella TaxID=2685852 RepID=UPI003AF4E967
MLTDKKALPIGIQTFAKIREGHYHYVDKTGYIFELVKEQFIFLSRPRRFGKSLTLDTIAELFQANQALFKGLIIYDQWDWSIAYPVIRLSFVIDGIESVEQLKHGIHLQLQQNAQRLGIGLADEPNVGWLFEALISTVSQHYQQRVVVLIDEYDKPILDNLTNPSVARAIRDTLRSFYSVIKAQDRNIHFAMLTGVSKFSKVNLFSGLNNLLDVTLDSRFSAICGYTQAELQATFADLLANVDLNQLKNWYNGYNWTGERVYNPFDVLLFLTNYRYEAHWFATGSPTFLLDKLWSEAVDITQIQNTLTDGALLSQFDVGDISPIALLFQTGYLTIEAWHQLPYGVFYTLKLPNIEVQQSLNHAILGKYLPLKPSEITQSQSRLYQSFVHDDIEQLFAVIRSFFASIPHDWHRNNNIAHFEGYWASVFYAYFASIGLPIRVEDTTSQGRMDMVVSFANRLYIFEFKVLTKSSDPTPNHQGLQQIKEKNYFAKYQAEFGQIYLIGVDFFEQERSVNFAYQQLDDAIADS